MIIGIVTGANQRRRFYEVLLPSHTLLYFTPDEILKGISAYCDGFLLDTGLLSGERRKLRQLLRACRARKCPRSWRAKNTIPVWFSTMLPAV